MLGFARLHFIPGPARVLGFALEIEVMPPGERCSCIARPVVGLRVAIAHRLNPVAFINGARNIATVTQIA
jgi:hypothetical protein